MDNENSENDENDESEKNVNDESRHKMNDEKDQDENIQSVRRSERKHIQRIKINPDEIGECDDENDKDYK